MASRTKKSVIWQVRNLFDEYNTKYFGGTLTRPTIRITRATKYYGDFCVTESSGSPTLRLSGRLNRDPELLRDTLLHEMVHQYLWELGLPDWHGHAEAFQLEAQRVGVTI